MATTTPNFGWPVPTSTDLVKNGATAIEGLGDAIDASLLDLKGGTTGQVLAKASGTDMDFTWTTPSGGTNQFYAGKNKIINGDFGIWQRGTSFTSSGYTADRFTYTQNGSTCTVSQQTFTPGTAPVAGYEGQYFARCAVTSVAGASNYVWFRQLIENVRIFAGQTVTISFWAKADAAKPISIEFEQNFGSGGSAAVQTFVGKPTLTTSWARYSYSFTVPSIAGKTLAASTWSHLAFWLDAGSTYNTRTSSLGQQNITFDVWGVQVEAGSTATDFVTASGGSLQGELAMCQRYYIRYTGNAAAQNPIGTGFALATTQAQAAITLPVTQRVTASVSYSAAADITFTWSAGTSTTSSLNPDLGSPQSLLLRINTSGLTVGQGGYYRIETGTAKYLDFSAEL